MQSMGKSEVLKVDTQQAVEQPDDVIPDATSDDVAEGSSSQYDLGDVDMDDEGGEDDPAGRDRMMITELLEELERNQATFGRISEAFGFSEKENVNLLEMLAQLRSERQELLARIASRQQSSSRSRGVSERRGASLDANNNNDSFAGALQADIDLLRIRVSSLDDENRSLKLELLRRDQIEAELRRQLEAAKAMPRDASPVATQPPLNQMATVTAATTPQSAQPSRLDASRAPSYHVQDDDEDHDEEEDEDASPSTTVGSVEGSPLPYRHQSEHKAAVLVRDAAVQCASQSHIPTSMSMDEANVAPPAARSTTSGVPEVHRAAKEQLVQVVKFDEVALAKRQLVFQAEEEKLWLMIHARTRELEHVSRLLASAEGRNVDLSALLHRICEQQQQDESQQLVVPPAPAALPAPAVAPSRSTMASSPAGRSRLGPQRPASTAPQFLPGPTLSAPQLRSANVPPPPARLGQPQHPHSTQLGNSGHSSTSDRPPGRGKGGPLLVGGSSMFRRESTFGKILVEKPRWS